MGCLRGCMLYLLLHKLRGHQRLQVGSRLVREGHSWPCTETRPWTKWCSRFDEGPSKQSSKRGAIHRKERQPFPIGYCPNRTPVRHSFARLYYCKNEEKSVELATLRLRNETLVCLHQRRKKYHIYNIIYIYIFVINTKIAQYFLYLQKVENNLNKSCNAKFANNFFTQKKVLEKNMLVVLTKSPWKLTSKNLPLEQ